MSLATCAWASSTSLRLSLGQFKPLMQLLLKSTVANLLQDIGVARFVNFECFAALGADDFVHGGASSFCYLLPNRTSACSQSSLAALLALLVPHVHTGDRRHIVLHECKT